MPLLIPSLVQTVAAAPALPSSLERSEALLEEAVQKRSEGAYSQAAALAAEALALRQEALPEGHAALGSAHNVLAVMLTTAGRGAESLPHFERALEVAEAHGDDLELATTAHSLGMTLHQLGRTDEGMTWLERALEVRQALLAPDHPGVASTLNALGSVNVARGALSDARTQLEQALAIRESALGPDDWTTTSTRRNLAVVDEMQGDLDTAVTRLREVRAAEAHLAPEHPSHLATAGLLSRVLIQRGDPTEAMVLVREVSAAREARVGPDDSRTADLWMETAHHAYMAREMAHALDAARRALAIRERALGPDHPAVAIAATLAGDVLRKDGQLRQARPLLERALAIYDSNHGADDDRVLTTQLALGRLHQALGDTRRARALFQHVLDRSRHVLGDTHVQVAVALASVARVDLADGALTRGLEGFEEALRTAERVVGPDHPRLGQYLNNVGVALQELGRFDEAVAPQRRAHAIAVAAYGEDDPRVVTSLANVAWLHLERGHTDEAIAAFSRCAQIRERALGPDHPDLAKSLATLARALGRVGRGGEARSYARRALTISTGFVDTLLPELSEREAVDFVSTHRRELDVLLSLLDAADEADEAWRATLAWKGAVAAATARRRATSAEGAADVAASLADKRRALARLTLAPFDPGGAEVRTARLAKLLREAEDLERTLAAGVAPSPRRAAPEDVCEGLPPQGVLVDYLVYMRGDEALLTAFVVEEGCAARRVELGPVAAVADAVAGWREVLAAGSSTLRIDGRGGAVRRQVWDPLGIDAPVVVLAPDGPVAGVSFAALPADGDRYLVEEVTLSYVESAGDLQRWPPTEAPGEGALLVGHLDYGAIGVPRDSCVARGFAPLPGTAIELDAIARSWPARQGPLDRLSGTEADEATLASRLPGHRVVHLATHGFFAAEDCWPERGAGVGPDPMTLSGVVASRANAPADPDGPWDGILTAAEVSGLDLRGTRLVVMSACDSGLGEVRSGEGVLGLRRAFAAAGAATLLMSLWQVDDDATAELMVALYRRLASRRPSPAPEALRTAQRERLAANREAGDPMPSTWGAFASVGDWRTALDRKPRRGARSRGRR